MKHYFDLPGTLPLYKKFNEVRSLFKNNNQTNTRFQISQLQQSNVVRNTFVARIRGRSLITAELQSVVYTIVSQL